MSMQWIRDHYPVPAKRGMRVEIDGKPGRILSTNAGHLVLHLDGNRKSHRTYAHPCWRMKYFDDQGNVLMDTTDMFK